MRPRLDPAEDLILVVDDIEASRFSRCQILRKSGYKVLEATNAAEALQLTAAASPALVLLDVGLPDLSGYEVCRRIRQAPGLSHVVVLHTSATFVQDDDKVRGLEGGADGYLVEPIDAGVLLATVRALLRMRRAEKDLGELLEREHDARREAEVANRIKDDFVATVSHELRTPLNAIVGWSYLLREGRLDEVARKQAIEVIERNARLQSEMIEDLLDVSRMVSGKLRLNPLPEDLREIVQSAVNTTRPAAEAKDIAVKAILAEDVLPLAVDRRRIEQVLDNLLSNAVKFTPRGGRIEVRLEESGGGVRIAVSDTGLGMRPDFLPQVFDRFRQEGTRTDRSKSGLGLGLAIARQIVELHGGTIEAESDGEGKGSTFAFTLPRTFADTAGELLDGSSLDGVRVLVVDDDQDPRDLYSYALRDHGAEVEAVSGTREAFEAIGRMAPDVLVSDIGMPGEDGFRLIMRLRDLPEHAGGQIPALAVTAFARDEDRELALASGYDDYLSKPVDAIRLVAAVARLSKGRG
jgi:signal transduction histidine kinase